MALASRYDLVPICPEQLGGLPTPRTPSEIQPDGRVTDQSGDDRTGAFHAGAESAFACVRDHGCKRAILKAKSPSCGVSHIYDGSFTGTLIPGEGITATLFRKRGIELADETSFTKLFGISPPQHPSPASPKCRNDELTSGCPGSSANHASFPQSKRPAEIIRVVITGGPCAGKTTAMEVLRDEFSNSGVPAVFVPEAATDLILSGIAPWTCASMLEFQTRVMKLQIEREREALEQAKSMARIDGWHEIENSIQADSPGQAEKIVQGGNGTCNESDVQADNCTQGDCSTRVSNVLVVCDRGICDSHAYLSDDDYERALTANGLTEEKALARYDAVFHLESVAKANCDDYTKANNAARFETAIEAIEADDRVIDAWHAHPHVHLIPNEPAFEQKARNLVRAITHLS